MACNDQDAKWVDDVGGQSAPFMVDGFNVPSARKVPATGVWAYCRHFFLTHFHSDHYTGLSHRFNDILYCTEITARLVHRELRVRTECIRILSVGNPIFISDLNVTFVLLDANHCPGSVVLLFYGNPCEVFLHTGDFRASPELIDDINEELNKIGPNAVLKKVWLDTTYALPEGKWRLPSQRSVLDMLTRIALYENQKWQGSCRFVIGGYTVGKERAVLAISQALGVGFAAGDARRRRVLMDCGYPGVHVADERSRVVFVGMQEVTDVGVLSKWVSPQFERLIAIHPTGWDLRKGQTPPTPGKSGAPLTPAPLKIDTTRRDTPTATLYSVPYSEHSSFDELRHFVAALCKSAEVISTVGKTKEIRATAVKAVSGGRQTTIREMFASNGRNKGETEGEEEEEKEKEEEQSTPPHKKRRVIDVDESDADDDVVCITTPPENCLILS